MVEKLKTLLLSQTEEAVFEFISRHRDIVESDGILLIATNNIFNILKEDDNKFSVIVNLERVNDIKRLNKFFKAVNSKLPVGGRFICCVETYYLRKQRILEKFPPVIGQVYYFFDFIFKRVFPKFPITKKIYFFITNGRNRVLSKAETFGRLYSCGFKLVDEALIGSRLYFIAEKIKPPIIESNPSYGPIFKMRRIGKDGKIIYCYKLRTMHAYSEYLQEYIYQKNNLQEGGKFKDDFRVTTLGRVFRKFWIDELPMILNLLQGDLKIVGVRPLSKHYLSLYPIELQEKRKKFKPGLIPPFYVDLPKTIDEIVDSEMKYLKAYEKAPLFTDIKYFILALYKIVIKKARSN